MPALGPAAQEAGLTWKKSEPAMGNRGLAADDGIGGPRRRGFMNL